MRAIVVLGLGLLGIAAGSEDPAGRCGELAKGWTTACSAASGLTLEAQTCLPGRLVVEADLGADGTLSVDITPDSPTAVARSGGAAFSPVGSFDNWNSEPAARRGVIEALVRCAEKDPSLLDRAEKDSRASTAPAAPSGPSNPSRRMSGTTLMWIVGGIAAVVVLGGLIRSRILSK